MTAPKKYITRTTQLTVLPEGDCVFSEFVAAFMNAAVRQELAAA
jgi:hypothetical protein